MRSERLKQMGLQIRWSADVGSGSRVTGDIILLSRSGKQKTAKEGNNKYGSIGIEELKGNLTNDEVFVFSIFFFEF